MDGQTRVEVQARTEITIAPALAPKPGRADAVVAYIFTAVIGGAATGAGGFALIIVPSLDLVIYKMGGNNGQYDPNFTTIPQPEASTARDDWKPIVGTPFVEGSRGGDDGIRRVLEMVCAAVRMN